ncbi:hypothetical protein L914_03596 [Phytophthora nicotianae]|uniref:Uncharacterized protein n=1 Tax=Phytophthora nicotianae TaxID=4792 RepID=W2NVV7_PHYNI|nr:hypothetical protein L914_03596 [Phytophthora nicotianae]
MCEWSSRLAPCGDLVGALESVTDTNCKQATPTLRRHTHPCVATGLSPG